MQNLKKYLLEKLAQEQAKKEDQGIVPNHVSGRSFRDAIMDDIREAMMEMLESGEVQDGKELNDYYLKVGGKR